MAEKVVKLVEYTGDCRSQTVEDMLKEAITESKGYPKAIILFLDDREGYTTGYSAAGLHRSEIIALLDIAKEQFLRGILKSDDWF